MYRNNLWVYSRPGRRYDPAGWTSSPRPPVNRRIDDRHHHVTGDGLGVWFTIQVTAHRRILEAVFERDGSRPTDDECLTWLRALMPDREPAEAPGLPGAHTRRFEVFEP